MSRFIRGMEALGARNALGLAAVIAAVALMLFLLKQGSGLSNDTAKFGVMSLQLAWTEPTADRLIASWTGANRSAAVRQVLWDFPFLVAYSWSLFYFGLWGNQRARSYGRPGWAAAARFAAWGGLLAGVFDVLENIGLLTMLHGGTLGIVAAFTAVCASLKFLLIAGGLVLPLLAAGISQPVGPMPQLSWGSMRRTTRATIGVLLVTAIALLVPSQTRDMLAGLSGAEGQGIWAAIAFNLALWLMAASAWHWSRAVLSARFRLADDRTQRANLAERPGSPVDPTALAAVPRLLFVAAAAVGMIAAVRSEAWWQVVIISLWTTATLILLYFRLELQRRFRGHDDWTYAQVRAPGPEAPVRSRLHRVFSRPLIKYAPLGPWVASLFLLLAAGSFVFGAIGTLWPEATRWSAFAPWLGRVFPGPSAVLLCLALSIGPLTWLTWMTDRIHIGGRFFGVEWRLRRPPIFLLLVGIVVVVPTLVNLHAVRTVPATAASMSVDDRKTLDDLFKSWADKCQRAGSVRPVIVAISGGASPAGLWGARVLAEADAAAAAGGTGIFAISSVSGGSLGAAAYAAALAGQVGGCTLGEEVRTPFYNAAVGALGHDALGPALAGALFGDVPRALLGLPAHWARRAVHAIAGTPFDDLRGGDRAEALERAFEDNWSSAVAAEFGAADAVRRQPVGFSEAFLSLAYRAGAEPLGMPVWIANGTDADSGVRILTAPFNVAASPFLGALDALGRLNSDVPISTAIHNTARFPVISPAGELTPLPSPRPTSQSDAKTRAGDDGKRTQVIDGGYFENEGLLTAWELARYLEANGSRILGDNRAVKPILVQATAYAAWDRIVRCTSPSARGSGEPTRSLATSRPVQALVPFIGLNSARSAHSDWILRRVQSDYCDPQDQRFFNFYLYPGTETVPLNWVLSQAMSCKVWQFMADADNAAESAALLGGFRRASGGTSPAGGTASRSIAACPEAAAN